MKVLSYPIDEEHNTVPLPVGKLYGIRTSVNATGQYISGLTGMSFQTVYNSAVYSPGNGPLPVDLGDMVRFNVTAPATVTIFYD